jgi:hypothetical protein
MTNVISAIVASCFLGLAFIGVFIAGLIKSGSSTQQLRWVLGLALSLVLASGFASVSLGQPYVDRPNDDAPGGIHSVLWGIPAMHVLSVPLGVGVLTLGLFQSLGARILPVTTIAFTFGSLALAVFLDNFDKWFWVIIAGVLYVLFCVQILFVDRLDRLAAAVTGRRRAGEELTEGWVGLPWRVGIAVLLGVFGLIFCLDKPVSNIISDYTWSIFTWVVLDVVYAIIVFLVWWFVQPVEFQPAAPISNLAATYAGAEAPKASPMGDNRTVTRRTNGAGPYTVLTQ